VDAGAGGFDPAGDYVVEHTALTSGKGFLESGPLGKPPAAPTPIEVPFAGFRLRGDSFALSCSSLVLHGAGTSSRERFLRLRQALNAAGRPSAGFDFIGHGETGGSLVGSSLEERTAQAAAVIRSCCREPLTLIGASMSGHTGIRLTREFQVAALVLLVPAVYTAAAYRLPFGPRFSEAIRVPGSWRDSDAFEILGEFKGSLLIIAAEHDHVIPSEVPQRLYASARNAGSRTLHIVPGSGHLSLFPTEQDLISAVDLIAGMAQDR
jgi:pimeloyl-ACP methyl ester carboxylesterase